MNVREHDKSGTTGTSQPDDAATTSRGPATPGQQDDDLARAIRERDPNEVDGVDAPPSGVRPDLPRDGDDDTSGGVGLGY